MRKLLFLVLAVALLSPPLMAVGPKFGAGAAAGLDIPVVQDDQSQGLIFGFRGRVHLVPQIVVEPNLFFTKYGDPSFDDPDFEGITADVEGSKVTAYGVDALLGMGFGITGFHPYGVLGAGFYKVKNDQREQDDTDFGWSGGLGIELGFNAPVTVDVRGKLVVIPIEGASKKSVTVTGGVNYYFGL